MRALHDILRARAFACTRTDVVYTQGNPFIGAKRKRVPAVIRQTGCIIDRGIEFSLCPCPFVRFASSSSFSASLSVSCLYPLHPFARCHCTRTHTHHIHTHLHTNTISLSLSLMYLARSALFLSRSRYSLYFSPPSSYVPLSQLDMNATRLLLMHPSICILQTGCIKSRPSARYFAVKRVIYYSIW